MVRVRSNWLNVAAGQQWRPSVEEGSGHGTRAGPAELGMAEGADPCRPMLTRADQCGPVQTNADNALGCTGPHWAARVSVGPQTISDLFRTFWSHVEHVDEGSGLWFPREGITRGSSS